MTIRPARHGTVTTSCWAVPAHELVSTSCRAVPAHELDQRPPAQTRSTSDRAMPCRPESTDSSSPGRPSVLVGKPRNGPAVGLGLDGPNHQSGRAVPGTDQNAVPWPGHQASSGHL
uniref:Uncharacterized protein n=1 Tax=Oryza sativa subsp. japonica TaxID=39947 RepID=Q5Z772_ORYSJ|nr:hypothetical protein [Oryza sativa Japonica Group]